MAFAYFTKDEGQVHRIAENENAKSLINCKEEDYTVATIDDNLFQDIIKSKKWIRYENDAVVVEDIDFEGYQNNDELQEVLNSTLAIIKPWTWNNQNHSSYNDVKNYCNFVKDFKTSSITFPLNQTWEEYCESNSITFFHPLQL